MRAPPPPSILSAALVALAQAVREADEEAAARTEEPYRVEVSAVGAVEEVVDAERRLEAADAESGAQVEHAVPGRLNLTGVGGDTLLARGGQGLDGDPAVGVVVEPGGEGALERRDRGERAPGRGVLAVGVAGGPR